MTIGTLLGIAASASVLAQSAARKRGRNPQRWGVLVFLFPIALVALWCLGPRPATKPGLTPAVKPPTADRPSGWADTLAPSTEQHVAATNERGLSAASLAETW